MNRKAQWSLPRCTAQLLVATLLCTSLYRWVGVAQADEPVRLPKVGEVWMSTPDAAAFVREPLHASLRDLGYQDGVNITVVARYAGRDPKRLSALVDELIAAKVDVMFVTAQAVQIAKEKTRTIPIVCATWTDPVAEGWVASLARPGGNITGPAA